MREVKIPGNGPDKPGGIAYFRDKHTGAGRKKLRAAGISASTKLSEYPELLEGPRPGESPEARTARIEAIKVQLTPEQAEFIDDLKEAAVLATLDSWTLDDPLPTTLEELEDLDGDLFDALLEATVNEEDTEFDPDGKKFDPNTPLEEQSPTGASTSSEDLSSENQPSPQTPELTSDGSPIDGEASSPEQ